MIVEEGIIEVDLAIEGNELKVLQHAHKLIWGRNFNEKWQILLMICSIFFIFTLCYSKNQTHTLIIGHTSKQEVSVPFLLASQKVFVLMTQVHQVLIAASFEWTPILDDDCLFDELLGFEIFSQIQNLPCCKSQKAAHWENGEVQYPWIRGFIGVSHLEIKEICG